MSERKYLIELSQSEYLNLLQFIMKYGTGTGQGGSTYTALRISIADAQLKGAYDHA